LRFLATDPMARTVTSKLPTLCACYEERCASDYDNRPGSFRRAWDRSDPQ
jgi:hypothetical protein